MNRPKTTFFKLGNVSFSSGGQVTLREIHWSQIFTTTLPRQYMKMPTYDAHIMLTTFYLTHL